MKILLFEYFTASKSDDHSIISEAKAMIEGLLNELKNFEVHLLISKNFLSFFKGYDFVSIISIEEDLFTWLEINVSKFNKVMFIGAEEDMILYELTKLIEDQGVEILGSNSKGVLKCSNKHDTYLLLKDRVTQPRTIKITADNNDHHSLVEQLFSEFNSNLVVKPVCGVDCQDTILVSDEKDICNLNDYENDFLVQEFVEGEIVSVSLISDGNESLPISLNKQLIAVRDSEFSYLGGEIPFNHPLKHDAFEVAKTAIEAIGGLKGFVGVDLILSDDRVYFLEINSRFTTSYVGLTKVVDINIGETIVKLLTNQIDLDSINFKFNGEVRFIKKGEYLDVVEFPKFS
ncbi:MAG: ATP-grasp domain-containing protein [Methanobrevibacter sp.]|jgi:predicted ATP-grasp superfamily ATP-dependent carboligase|nr:ATP-grasp domain-containing protein [Candidatus Methanovirga aequatorialis]